MRLYYASDVHNDYNQRNVLLDFSGDKDGVLIVAGDINCKGRSTRDLEEIADRWRYVVAVPGNHDWWNLALHETHKFTSEKGNVNWLLDDYLVLGDVVIVGTTLWHEIGNPIEELQWQQTMRDATRIRGVNYRRLKGWDITNLHLDACRFIEEAKTLFQADYKMILVTHHALSNKSIHEKYQGSMHNRFYATDKPDLLEGYKVHVHGHVHQSMDYELYGCNVVCNPHGYGSENLEFGLCIIETDEL